MLYLIIAAYFGVLLLLGVLASRRVESLSDYYLGGKRLGYWVAAFSTRATGESAWLYLGLTGLGAAAGLSALWVVVGEVLGVGTAWFLMAAPFKRATDRSGAITVPDYLVSRFGSSETPATTRRLRLVAAGALALFVTIYVSAQIDATGKAFAIFLDWNYYTGALVGFGIVVIYTYTGGFLAVAWSDLFQGLLMLAGLVVLPVAAFAALAPGALTAGIDPVLLNPWGPGGATLPNLLTIVSYAAIGIGFLGSPQVFVRFMAIRDQTQIRAGRWVAIAFTLATDTGAVLSGLLGRALLVGADGDFAATLGPSGEQVLPVLVEHLFPPLVVGLFVAAVLAAIMSTIDSLLVVASSAVTRDVYQQTLHPDLAGETLIGLSRRVTLALAFVALAVALSVAVLVPERTIFWYVIFGWSGIAATFCPVIVLSLVWRRYNAHGALASMITGLIAVPVFKFLLPLAPGWGPVVARAEELAPSFLVALAAGVIATLVSSRRAAHAGPPGARPVRRSLGEGGSPEAGGGRQ
ncbi:MAG: sodium/proline symporter [Acidobacteria bacterium]|nr:MAG: sodium/proline symporter [Acidobacteriota bacterium]